MTEMFGAVREPTVEIQRVQHAFGSAEQRMPVLFDIDLHISAGEMVIMTGPSGSGKTTLLTLIGALRSVQEGSLRVLDRELHGLDEAARVGVRRDLGFIFQAHNLFASLTALDNVRLALQLRELSPRQIDQRARQVLVSVGLEDRMHHKPEALSGGQRQRVAVARALAHGPKVILADEPTAALDGDSSRLVIERLEELGRELGTSTLLVTHDNRVLHAADRIINMVDGHIVSDVRVGESIEICEFLARVPAFASHTPGALAEIAEHVRAVELEPGHTIFRQGDPGDRFYLIKRGAVDILDEQAAPAGQVMATLQSGDFFGEVALIADQPRNATARVAAPTQLYTLSTERFKLALQRSKNFREQLLDVFSARQ